MAYPPNPFAKKRNHLSARTASAFVNHNTYISRVYLSLFMFGIVIFGNLAEKVKWPQMTKRIASFDRIFLLRKSS